MATTAGVNPLPRTSLKPDPPPSGISQSRGGEYPLSPIFKYRADTHPLSFSVNDEELKQLFNVCNNVHTVSKNSKKFNKKKLHPPVSQKITERAYKANKTLN